MAFYLLVQPIFLSTYYQPGIVLDPGTILNNLQYNQTCKVICGKVSHRMSHMEKDLKGHQIQHRLFTGETAEAWADIYSESSNVFGLLRLQR